MVSACLTITLLCLFYYSMLGENFDRQASLRRSLIYTDTLVRRPKKVKRRKTISGIPDIIQKELGTVHQHCVLLPLLAAPIYRTNLMWSCQFHTFRWPASGWGLGGNGPCVVELLWGRGMGEICHGNLAPWKFRASIILSGDLDFLFRSFI